MKAWLPIAAALMISGHSFSQEISLDELITRPGSYSQLCDIASAPEDIPFSLYQQHALLGASFSEKKLNAAKKNRAALITEIRARLLKIDFSRKPQEVSKDLHPDESMNGDDVGCDANSLNPLLLDLILELEATEALPELLVLEDKLVHAIAVTKNDASAPSPWVDGWFVLNDQVLKEYETHPKKVVSNEKQERPSQLFNARAAQRDLVTTMCRLLREKKYEPFLNTALEKAFVAGIKQQAAEENFSQLKHGDPIPEELKGRIKFDPVTGLPYKSYPAITAPYTRESRDEVRAVAQKWIAEHP
jgi:hypothetical protein